ncbi:MAG: hypothetical protein ACOH2J_05575 [Allorhizobium sp.]
MRLADRIVLMLAISAAATQALADADAVTYAGTLGKAAIIVEMVATPTAAGAYGRYSYLSKGVDIPLHGLPPAGGIGLRLREEKPCSEQTCMGADGVPASSEQVQFGAEWQLDGRIGDALLSGSWRDLDSGKRFAVRLSLQARRSIEERPDDRFSALDPLYENIGANGNPPMLTPASLPYDFLKIAPSRKPGEEITIGAGVVRLDIDSRVGMDYPTVVTLAGTDPARLNAYLEQRRLQAEIAAFSCLSDAYLGFGWNGSDGPGTSGYEDEWTVTVEHLTSRLMGLSESGSYYCGGPHPHNFSNHYLADVRSGAALTPEFLLRGWVATDDSGVEIDRNAAVAGDLAFHPNADLVAYVIAHRQKFDAETESDCDIDTLVPDNLGVYLKQDKLVFTLKDLPNVIFACTDDLLELPLKDARPLLTEDATGNFSELD